MNAPLIWKVATLLVAIVAPMDLTIVRHIILEKQSIIAVIMLEQVQVVMQQINFAPLIHIILLLHVRQVIPNLVLLPIERIHVAALRHVANALV
jgi:hypothetical protein